MNNLYFLVYAFLILATIMIIYYRKERIKNIETGIFSALLITTMVEVCLALTIIFLGYKFPESKLIITFNKLDFTIYIVYAWFLFLYVVYISFNYKKKFSKSYNKVIKITMIINLLLVLAIMILPFNIVNDQDIMYADGAAVNLIFMGTGFYILACVICALANFKNLLNKKYLPLLALIVLIIVVMILRTINPALMITTLMLVYVDLMMFFTIENPDVKMINELNIAKDQAVKANNAKTDFLSSMSHEIRTPLNAIVGFSQIISENEKVPEDVKEEIGHIMNASDNLLEIVNGILDISKIEANKLEIIKSEYEFKKVFNELVAFCNIKIKANDKPIEFISSYDESIPPVLYGDHARVKQIILNLLTNSIKYTPQGSITFNVDSVIHNGVVRLIISVEDTGIGIKKEKIDKLFTRFERLEVEKNTTAEGTGLGLAITKKLVELMKGKIVVQSEYGTGSKFTVAIDQKIVEDKKKLEKTKVLKLDKALLNFKGKKVLIVDDNIVNLKVASRLLLKYNVESEEVDSGKGCLEKIESGNKYDLILLDDMMPIMTGTETLKKLRKIPNFNTPVIALTANAITGMREKYLASGFTDYIAKPMNMIELENKLRKYLG